MPRHPHHPDLRLIQTRIPKDVSKALEATAKSEGHTVASWLRKHLQTILAGPPSAAPGTAPDTAPACLTPELAKHIQRTVDQAVAAALEKKGDL